MGTWVALPEGVQVGWVLLGSQAGQLGGSLVAAVLGDPADDPLTGKVEQTWRLAVGLGCCAVAQGILLLLVDREQTDSGFAGGILLLVVGRGKADFGLAEGILLLVVDREQTDSGLVE